MTSHTLSADVIPFSFPGVDRVRCLFTTAAAGNMSLDSTPEGGQRAQAVRNRRQAMNRAGFARWAELRQVHGDALVRAEGAPRPDKAGSIQADGHFTLAADMGLVVKTADCQPILIARDDGGAVAALHVGWRGNAQNFPGTAVERLCRAFACQPRDLLAVRGPSLGPAASEFVNFAREWPGEFLPWYNPADKSVNLWELTRHQLRHAGLLPERIFSLDMCTRTLEGAFFSHRRREAGRQIGIVWIAP